MASVKFNQALTLSFRTVTDLFLSGISSEVINSLFPDVPDTIDSNEQALMQVIWLILQSIVTVFSVFELKDFFYDDEYPDPTDGLVYSFFVMFQPKLINRFRLISFYTYKKMTDFVNSIQTSN